MPETKASGTVVSADYLSLGETGMLQPPPMRMLRIALLLGGDVSGPDTLCYTQIACSTAEAGQLAGGHL